MIVDAWMQHPTLRFLRSDFLGSLRRWTGALPEEELPLAATIATMDVGGVDYGLISAWHGPAGALITNDEVAGSGASPPSTCGTRCARYASCAAA
jgi:uncharacterized protein